MGSCWSSQSEQKCDREFDSQSYRKLKGKYQQRYLKSKVQFLSLTQMVGKDFSRVTCEEKRAVVIYRSYLSEASCHYHAFLL